MATVLVTGHTGYLGSCLAAQFAAGGWNVDVLPNRLENLTAQSIRADAVVHAAAALRHRHADLMRVNAEGTANLLAALTGDPFVVHISTRSVFRPQPDPTPLDETARPDPQDAYGESKLAAEGVVSASGLRHVIIRSTGLSGVSPSGEGRGVLTRMAGYALRAGRMCIHPTASIDTLHVRDLARCIVRLCESPPEDRLLHAAGPRVSLAQAAQAVCEAVRDVTGRECVIDEDDGPAPPGVLLDSRRIMQAGYLRHETSLDATCREIATALIRHLQEPKPA
ncbi:nucleoside-diphosphate-sugar epimerase [Desulfobaculum xiamenense]|uniref:Nucleoside-diphosphate-sugar epimerase n=1 Tax=Desulfobaculum xiamenense TaxID=995050 RepID=A0A846QWM3_9BACT|nr:NAD(P)-dependent oxidoreductase [Desulfobaculum xiamenense]NJB69514.1 nucleoside-diphosphate-sugar epimerase [Desulfobaculum xiamenense]